MSSTDTCYVWRIFMGSTPFYHNPEEDIGWDPAAEYPPEKIRLNVGRRIQQKLYDLGWKQTDLAERAGLGRDSVSLYIRGKNLPGARNMKAMADALGMSIEELAPELQTATRKRTNSFGPQEMKQRSDGLWHVKIDRPVDQKTMLKIISALDAYDDSLKGFNAA